MLCHRLYDTSVFAGLPTHNPHIQILIETKRCVGQYRGDPINSTIGVSISISLRCLNIALTRHHPLACWRGCVCRPWPGSIRELPGLCTGLLGRRPLGACLLTEGIDRGIEGGEEVIRIEGANEFVALELRSDGILEFGEHQ